MTDFLGPRHLVVFTGHRSDYGLLKTTIRTFKSDSNMQTTLVAGGPHMSPEHGRTVDRIREDGLGPDVELEFMVSGDSRRAVGMSLGLGVSAVSDALHDLRPDMALLLGDRWETFAAASAAVMHGVPVAHVHGGEITKGSVDNDLRDAITKMARLHLVAAPQFRDRIIAMGECMGRVHVVGAPGLELIEAAGRMSWDEVAAELGLPAVGPLYIVSVHPESARHDSTSVAWEVADALEGLPEGTVLIIGACPDDSWAIIASAFGRPLGHRVVRRSSVSRETYLSALRHAAVLVGNSSSGVIEAPSVNTPSVDVGSRQEGRPRAESVIWAPAQADEIRAAVLRAMTAVHKVVASRAKNPYHGGATSTKIHRIIRGCNVMELRDKP